MVVISCTAFLSKEDVLQLRQNRIRARHSNLSRTRLILRIRDGAILLHHNRIPAVPIRAQRPAMVLREARLGVGEEEQIVALDVVHLAPGVHDPRVVGGDDGDDVDALGLQLRQLLNVGREVHGLAAGREGAGHGDEDDFLAGEVLGGVVLLWAAAVGRVRVDDWNPAGACMLAFVIEILMRAKSLLELDSLWELVAYCKWCHYCDVMCC